MQQKDGVPDRCLFVPRARSYTACALVTPCLLWPPLPILTQLDWRIEPCGASFHCPASYACEGRAGRNPKWYGSASPIAVAPRGDLLRPSNLSMLSSSWRANSVTAAGDAIPTPFYCEGGERQTAKTCRSK